MRTFIEIVLVLGVILFSMILHELAHGGVAYLLGDDTAKEEGRLSLNPFKHLDPMMSVVVPMILYIVGAPVFGGAKPVPIDRGRLRHGEFGMALVALAGPLTNFLIALICFLIGHYTGLLQADGIGGDMLRNAVMINLGFMVFNCLPIPPLDGSRLLYAIVPDGVRNIMDVVERSGVLVVYAMILVFGSVLSSVMGGMMNTVIRFFYLLVGL